MAEKRTLPDEHDSDEIPIKKAYRDYTPEPEDEDSSGDEENPEGGDSSGDEENPEGGDSSGDEENPEGGESHAEDSSDEESVENWFSSWEEKKASSYVLPVESAVKTIMYTALTENPTVVDPSTVTGEGHYFGNPIFRPFNCVYRIEAEMGVRVTFESGHYLNIPIVQDSHMYFTPYKPSHMTGIEGNDPYNLRNYDIDITEEFGYDKAELAGKPVAKIRVSQLDNSYEKGLCIRFLNNAGEYITYKPECLSNPSPKYTPAIYMLNDTAEFPVFASASFHSPDGTMITSVGYDIGMQEEHD